MSGMIQTPFGSHGARVSRIEPVGRTDQYKTYAMLFPTQTHFRQATCEEVMCFNFLNGWKTVVSEGSPQAAIARSLKGSYSFTEASIEGGLVEFLFAPGQKCFKWNEHKLPLDRPGHFVVRPGLSWAPTGQARVMRPLDWVDDFANHQDKIHTALERG
jgi:hypothetical protein